MRGRRRNPVLGGHSGSERLRSDRLRMDDVHARFIGEKSKPAQELAAVGMRRESVDVRDLRRDRHRHAEDAGSWRATEERAAEGPGPLKSDKANGVVGSRKPISQMMEYPAAARHAARRYDHRFRLDIVERDGILR